MSIALRKKRNFLGASHPRPSPPLSQAKSPAVRARARKKKPPDLRPAVGGQIGRKRPIGRERDRETPQHEKLISQRSILQGEHGVTFL